MASSAGKPDLRAALGDEGLHTKQEGKVVSGTVSTLDGKYVAFYFSAHWCPPCRAFTPLLRKVYLLLQAQGKPFEIVFVSSDTTLQEFEDYYQEMPWMSVPYSAEEVRKALGRRWNVAGIPTLVMVDPEGHVVNKNARAAVVRDLDGQRFPWAGEEEASSGFQPGLPWLVLLCVCFFLIKWLFGG